MHRNKHRRLIISAVAVSIASALFVAAVSHTNLFKSWELKTYDLRMVAARGGKLRPKNVAIFYVDEKALADMSDLKWPWPREVYSYAIDFCRRGGARAVVFDIFYSEDSVYGVDDDLAFANSITRNPPAYFVLFLSGAEPRREGDFNEILAKSAIPYRGSPPRWISSSNSLASMPIPPLVPKAAGFGNAQIPPDEDGVYRRTDLLSLLGGSVVPSIALKVVADALDVKNISEERNGDIRIGDVVVPHDEDGRMLVNYYGGVDTFPSYSLSDVIISDNDIRDGRNPVLSPDAVKDKVVVIGLAAPGLYDMKSTPFSRTYPGSEVHATVIENLLTADFITPVPRAANLVLIAVCSLLAATILMRVSSSWKLASAIAGLVILLAFASVAAFAKGVWMPVVAPVGAVLMSSFLTIFLKFMTEGRKKREIRRAFMQYLSPEVVRELSEHPEKLALGGMKKEITVFFSDIADFTTISERTPPEALVEKLNEYFSVMTEILHRHGGTLDKYIGDAVMAFWNAPLDAPEHALLAVRASLEIQEALEKKNLFSSRIGIHTNEAIVGNIGSNIRFNYTAIGDTVNLASRLEGMNKNYGTKIIMSGDTRMRAGGMIEARRIGLVRVKGRNEPVGIFEPLGEKGRYGHLSASLLEGFHAALDMFESGRFKEAGDAFRRVAEDSDDAVSKKYKELCNAYAAGPPKDFDGVVAFAGK
jgi:adenylate cyclase